MKKKMVDNVRKMYPCNIYRSPCVGRNVECPARLLASSANILGINMAQRITTQ